MMYRRLDTASSIESPRSFAVRARDLLIGALAGALIALSFVWARPVGAKLVVDAWSVPGPDDTARRGAGKTAHQREASPLSPSWIWDRKPIRSPRV